MKIGPVKFGSWEWKMSLDKKEELSFGQQVLNAKTEAVMLHNQFTDLVENYVRAIRYNEMMEKDTTEDTLECKKALKGLYVVEEAQRRLSRIQTQQELNATMNNLNSFLKNVNGIDRGREKVNDESLNRARKKMQKNNQEENSQGMFEDVAINDSLVFGLVDEKMDIKGCMEDLKKNRYVGTTATPIADEKPVGSSGESQARQQEEEKPISDEVMKDTFKKESKIDIRDLSKRL